ncbi:DUF5819 family protein [Microbacterium keratanolyticum]
MPSTTTRRTMPALIVTVLVLALAAVHMFFTAVVNVPDSAVKYGSLPGAAADAYTRPLFVQNYRIFAPNPASEDRELWFRAITRDASGETMSPWVNATAVELAEPYRRVLRKQSTIIGAERFMAAHRALTPEQQEVAARDFRGDGTGGRGEFAQALSEGGQNISEYMTSGDYILAYATQAAEALWGENADVVAVQTRVVYDPVVRWNDRMVEGAERPASSYTNTGWREPIVFPGQNSEQFARAFRAWYASAPEEATLR